MSKKYYAVRKGRTPGIYQSWAECKAQTDGFPGAEYKGFATEPEAKIYLKGETLSSSSPLSPDIQPPENTAVAYVDGSYDKTTNRYSYGSIIFHNGNKIETAKSYSNTSMAAMKNVAGELMGAIDTMKWCVNNNVLNLHSQ